MMWKAQVLSPNRRTICHNHVLVFLSHRFDKSHFSCVISPVLSHPLFLLLPEVMCLCSSQTRGELSSPSSAAAGTPLSSRVTRTIKYPMPGEMRAVARWQEKGGPFAANSSEAAVYPSHIIKTLHLALNSLTSCTPARHLSPRAPSSLLLLLRV